MAIGYDAMTTNTAGGTENVAIGNYAGDAITSGDYNTALGHLSLSATTTASFNVAVGQNALDSGPSTGNHNVGIGYGCGGHEITMTFGYYALTAATSAGITAVGSHALQSLTDGVGHVAVGFEALKTATQHSYSTAIGYKALSTMGAAHANTAVGYHAGRNHYRRF